MITFRLTLAATLLLPCAAAFAQIAPPPAEAPAATPEYKRPPILVPRTATPAQDKPRVDLPNLPYESLVKKGPDGKVVRLTEPVTWLALRRNPTLTKEDWARLDPIIAARKAECENIAVKNLDLAEKVDSGEIERLDGDAKKLVQTIRGVFAPLKPSGRSFIAKLGDDGVLNEVQVAFGQKIESEYNTAVRSELRAGAKPKQDPNAIGSIDVVRYMFLEGIDETMWSYRSLLAEASQSLKRITPHVATATAAKFADDQRAVESASDPVKRAELFRVLLSRLDLQERRELLAKVIETREKK